MESFSILWLLEVKKINIKLLIGTVAGLLILQALPYFNGASVVNQNMAMAVRVFVIAYGSIIFWLSTQSNKQLPMIAFLVLLGIELMSFSYTTVNRNKNITAKEMSERIGYNDYTREAVDFIRKKDSSFTRIDKNYASSPAGHFSLNDGMVFDYYGTSCYTSFCQKYYLQYLRTYGIVKAESEIDSRWPPGLISRPILESLNSVKYVLAKGGYTNPNWHITHDSIGKFEDILILKNKYATPFGFTYNKVIRASELSKLSDFQKDILSLKAAVINDADMVRVKNIRELKSGDSINPANLNAQFFKDCHDSLSKDTVTISAFGRDNFSGKISLKSEKIIYLSIPYDIGWHAEVDGKSYDPILIANGMIGIAPGPGDHKIELHYQSPYHTEGKMAGLGGFVIWLGLAGLAIGRRKRDVDR